MSEAIPLKRFEPVIEKSKSGQKFTIRQAEFSELPAISRSISRNYSSASGFHQTVSDSFLEKFAGLLNEGKFPENYFVLVAEHPETKEILGISDASFHSDKLLGACRDAISFRKKEGIGEKLLFHEVKHLFKNFNAKTVIATVRKKNKPSLKNVLKLGFSREGKLGVKFGFSKEGKLGDMLLLSTTLKKFLQLNFKS